MKSQVRRISRKSAVNLTSRAGISFLSGPSAATLGRCWSVACWWVGWALSAFLSAIAVQPTPPTFFGTGYLAICLSYLSGFSMPQGLVSLRLRTSRGVVNSNQDSSSAEPYTSRGYVERLLSRSSPGTVQTKQNRRFPRLRRNRAIRSSWPAITSRCSTPAGSRTGLHLPVTSASAGPGLLTC